MLKCIFFFEYSPKLAASSAFEVHPERWYYLLAVYLLVIIVVCVFFPHAEYLLYTLLLILMIELAENTLCQTLDVSHISPTSCYFSYVLWSVLCISTFTPQTKATLNDTVCSCKDDKKTHLQLVPRDIIITLYGGSHFFSKITDSDPFISASYRALPSLDV